MVNRVLARPTYETLKIMLRETSNTWQQYVDTRQRLSRMLNEALDNTHGSKYPSLSLEPQYISGKMGFLLLENTSRRTTLEKDKIPHPSALLNDDPYFIVEMLSLAQKYGFRHEGPAGKTFIDESSGTHIEILVPIKVRNLRALARKF